MKKERSSFFQRLKQTRVILDPYEIAFYDPQGPHSVSPKALGVLIRLLPYVLPGAGVKPDIAVLARMANVSDYMMRVAWKEIERFFDHSEDGTVALRALDWLRVQTVSCERQRLRHLLDTLVAYWGNACVYCGTDEGELEIEHIVPVTRGGTDDLRNLTLACKPCNLKKRTQTAAEFGFPHVHDLAAKIQ